VWPVDEIFPVPNRDKVATGERDLQRERERRREREIRELREFSSKLPPRPPGP